MTPDPTFLNSQIAALSNLISLDTFYSNYHSNFSNDHWSLFFYKIATISNKRLIVDNATARATATRNINYLKTAEALNIEFPNKDEQRIRYIYTSSIKILYQDKAPKPYYSKLSSIVRSKDVLNLGNA